MTLHLGFSHAHQRNAEQQQEIRDARRLLKERTRNDWNYPPLPAFRVPERKSKPEDEEDEETRIAGFRFRNPSNHDREAIASTPSLEFEPLEWRERVYSSEESTDTESVATLSSPASVKSTYKFDGPDSVGAQLSARKLARKRKRQKALDEEVTWNEGLAHWLARRDEWSGARTSQQIQLLESSRETPMGSTSASSSASSTPRTSTSSNSLASAPVSSPSTTPDLVPDPVVIKVQPPAPTLELLIPLVPPILVNHPVRRRITPEIYPEIYAKIILQGRTPSVPINLLVLTRALVQGWKDDGEWPPKQAPLEKAIGRRKSSGHESALKSGVKAVGRVLRITSAESSLSGSKEKS